MSMSNISRRGFIAGSALSAGLLGLAGCSTSGGSASDPLAAPAADKYPIDPDGSDVKAKYASEEVRDGWTKYTNEDGGATLGVMDTSKIIQVDGYAFKDLDGDGKLSLWEDWRQSVDDRAAALAEAMSAEDLFPLLWAGGTQSSSTTTDTSAMDYIEQGSRSGVSRLQSSIDSYATDIEWINRVQETCEKDSYGIPYLNYSDPYVLFGVPSSVSLSTVMDKDLWRQAGMWQARAWRATGVRCDLGPQVDVYSNPIGTRLSGSVSEDPALNRDFAAAFGGGMQSTWGDDEATDDQGWGDESCAVMLKHFVGEGSNEGGRDDHSDSGKWNVFPGSNFDAHLVPFLDGGMHLDSKTEQMAAVMPCYGIAYDPNDPDGLGEHVGSAYSTHNISILRNAGWDGMICTDWMILDGIQHGMKDKTVPERYAKLMNNTISQHGGSFQPDVAKEAYDLMVKESDEDTALGTLRENARRIFKLMMTVDLFEQPYSDRTVAKQILENEKAAQFGADISDKCVVMLKNAGIISQNFMKDKPKVYIPQKYTAASSSLFGGETPASIAPVFGADLKNEYWDVVTDHVNASDNPQESDLTRLTAEELADVKYAIIKVNNPADAYQGVEGGPSFMTVVMGTEPEPGPYWKPISLQYRPFTADGSYVRKESLNPVDEYGEYVNRSVYGASTYATNESDLDLVLDVKSKLPADAKLILLVDADRPMCFGEIEPSCDAILLAFNGVSEEAYARVASGTVEPSGLLSFQMPKDMQTVFEQQEDVPRDMDCYTDADGNTYDFCFGLNWSGVIDDDRVKTYKATPLTKPETCEVKADA
ncbi:MAG: glycoside hydrolase family 3 N-terminal domain-containing protein [Coriobacteriia bacterium]|nr:glycoside hydrolase family 3 N-terminal domain-containing protein [Coriobacteriia bacterium]